MKRVLALAAAVTLLVGQFPPTAAQTSATGVITGTIAGPSGPVAGVAVQVLDTAGALAGTAVTTEAGAFSITGLNAGTFTVQAVGVNGAVLGVSSATLAEGAMAVAVTVNATAGVLAAAALAVTATAAATSGAAVSATTVIAAVGAAAAAVGTAAVVGTQEAASGSR